MATNVSYKYVLDGVLGRLNLNHNPEGWRDKKLTMVRSEKYHGIFMEFQAELSFVKEGREYLRNAYERYGVETEVVVEIFEYDPTKPGYREFFVGQVDFTTYKISELYAQVVVQDIGVSARIKKNESVKIPLSTLRTLKGGAIDANSPEYITVQAKDRAIVYIGDFVIPESNAQYYWTDHTVPWEIVENDIPDAQSVYDIDGVNNPVDESLLLKSAAATRYVTFEGRLKFQTRKQALASDHDLTVAVRVYDDFSTYTDTDLFTVTGITGAWKPVDETFSADILVRAQQAVAFVFRRTVVTLADYDWDIALTSLRLTNREYFGSSSVQMYLVHEALSRILQVITGQQDILRSDVLGRTDSQPQQYTEDGEMSLLGITGGKLIRGFGSETDPPVVTLAEMIESLDAVGALGMGVEKRLRQAFVRVEKKEYFYQKRIVLEINNARNIEKSVDAKWLYNQIEVGFKKAEYEAIRGLKEPNNAFSFNTYITSVGNTLSLVSPYRMDSNGWEFARRKSVQIARTEDTTYDEDIWMMSLRRSGTTYNLDTDEDFDLVENIFEPEKQYNLKFSPKRNLLRHGWWVRSGLMRYPSQYTIFRSAAKDSDMITRLTTETQNVVESNDVLNRDFDVARFYPEVYTFQSPFTREMVRTITKDPLGVIKFTSNGTEWFFGFILEVKLDLKDRIADWKLLRTVWDVI